MRRDGSVGERGGKREAPLAFEGIVEMKGARSAPAANAEGSKRGPAGGSGPQRAGDEAYEQMLRMLASTGC